MQDYINNDSISEKENSTQNGGVIPTASGNTTTANHYGTIKMTPVQPPVYGSYTDKYPSSPIRTQAVQPNTCIPQNGSGSFSPYYQQLQQTGACQEKQYERAVKKEINIGILIPLAHYVLSFALSFVLGMAVSLVYLFAQNGGVLVNADINEFLNFITQYDNLYGLIFNLAYYCLFISFTPLLIMAFRRQKFREVFPAKRVKPSVVLAAIPICLGLCYITNYITVFIQLLLSELGFIPEELAFDTASPKGWLSLLFIVVIAVAPAVLEEFSVRGVMIAKLRKSAPWAAIVFSAVVFSMMHGTVQQIPSTLVLGLTAGYFVVRYENLWIGVLIHFINNLVSCVLQLTPLYIDQTVINVAFVIYIGLIFCLLLIALPLFLVTQGISIKKSSPGQLNFRRSMAVLFSTPGFWIMVAASVIYFIMVNLSSILAAIQ